jgi:hypothetical protein
VAYVVLPGELQSEFLPWRWMRLCLDASRVRMAESREVRSPHQRMRLSADSKRIAASLPGLAQPCWPSGTGEDLEVVSVRDHHHADDGGSGRSADRHVCPRSSHTRHSADRKLTDQDGRSVLTIWCGRPSDTLGLGHARTDHCWSTACDFVGRLPGFVNGPSYRPNKRPGRVIPTGKEDIR